MPARIRSRKNGRKYPIRQRGLVDQAFAPRKEGLVHTATREPTRGVFTEGPNTWERHLISRERRKARLAFEKKHRKLHKRQEAYHKKHPDNLRFIENDDELSNLF